MHATPCTSPIFAVVVEKLLHQIFKKSAFTSFKAKRAFSTFFHGFLIMQNMIKPETTPVITELKNASLKTVMVTGDNLLTALNVARKCGIVPKMNKVIFVEAHPPGEPNAEDEIQREFTPARIDWQLAEAFNDFEEINTSYQSNFPVI